MSAIDTSARAYSRAAPLPASGFAFKARAASDVFKRLHERVQKLAAALDHGITTTDGENKKLLEHVKASYAAMPATLDVATEAAAYRMFSPLRDYRDDHGGELFARYWLAKEGGEFALRVLARAGKLSRATTQANNWSEPTVISIADSPHTDVSTWGKSDGVWFPIREWIASLDAATLAKTRALVAELRKGVPVSTRALLDAALGDSEFCLEDAKELVTTMSGPHPALVMWPALFSVTNATEVLAIVDKIDGWALQASVEHVPTLVVTSGEAAVPIVELLLNRGVSAGFGSDRTKEVGQALAIIRAPSVAEIMTRRLNEKDLRPIATEYLHTAPILAMPPLAALVAGSKGAHADVARSVLGVVVSKEPAEAHRLAPTLPDAQRAAIEAALDRFENLVDAAPEDLPRVLANPPWLVKKKVAAARIVAGVAPLARAGRVVWKNEAQRTEFKNEESYYAPTPANEAAILKEIDEAWAARKASAVGNYKIMQLPKESAIRTLATAPLEIFSWYYGNIATAFIGRYELDALDAVLRYATVDPTNAIEAFAVVDSPLVAPIIADAYVRLKKSRQAAQAWLAAYPETAATALVPIAIGETGKARTAAEAALRFLSMHGKRAIVEEVGDKYGADAKAALGDVLDFDPLSNFPAKLPKMPAFFNAGALPRPRLRGQKKVLPVSAIDALGTMLAFARVDDPYAGIGQVKEACEPSSLAELAWELFQAWLVAGAPSKEQWAFLALGHFGDDECARKLTPLVRAWPGEAAHARAVVGLDVLALIGTDVALMHLHGIAQKVKFKGLQQRARDKIDQIAEARGLTAEELGDRLVPDLGLEEDGSLALDFGPRKFRVVFDETLKPGLLDEGGKRVKDLPKPGKSDDAEKAAASIAVWKAMKKDAKVVASNQLLRLELAMCAQRRWEPDAFEQFFVTHPLLIHIVRRLVWGAFDTKNVMLGSFRVSEDGSYADTKDAKYTVPDGAKIGLVHRLQMDQKEADAWGQVLGDYEIMQPFAQLSREALKPTADEVDATDFVRVAGITVQTGKVLGLDNRGWRRGPPQDAGVVCWYEKPLQGDLVACLDLEPGIYTGMITESPQQKLGKCVVAKDANSWRRESVKKLGELSPIDFSELARDLESLRP